MELAIFGLIIVVIILAVTSNKSTKIEGLLNQITDSQKKLLLRLENLEQKIAPAFKDSLHSNEPAQKQKEPTPPPLPLPPAASAPTATLPSTIACPTTVTLPPNQEANTIKRFKRPQEMGKTHKSPTETTSSSKVNQFQNPNKTGLWNWFKEDWLMKVGSLMLLLALGWFVTYAVINNWIGPVGRILVGALASLGLMALGTKRIANHPNQGGVFLSIGTTMMTVTMFAASNFYTILTPIIGLLISAGALGFLATIAIKQKYKALVYLSITLATLCPFFFGYIGETEFILGYMLILILAIAYINWSWEQKELPLISSIITFFYSAPYTMFELNNWTTLSTSSIVLAFLAIAIIIAQNLYHLAKADEPKTVMNLISLGGLTLTLIGWSMKIGSQTTAGYTIAGWAVVLAIISWLIYLRSQNVKAFYATWALSAILGLLSLHILIEIPILTLTILLLCIANIAVAYKVSPKSLLPYYTSGSLALPALMTLTSLKAASWEHSVLTLDSLTVLCTTLTLMSSGIWLKSLNLVNQNSNEEPKWIYRILIISASIYGYWLTWLVCNTLLPYNMAIALTLSTYTLIGIICYFHSIKKESKVLRVYALILISLILTRLFLVELWRMEISARILTFFAVGLLLVSTAFFSKKRKTEKTEKTEE